MGKMRRKSCQKKLRSVGAEAYGNDTPEGDGEAGKDQASPDDEPADSAKVRPKAKAVMKEVTTARRLTKKVRRLPVGKPVLSQ